MAQAGWYQDPATPFGQRWWDGQRWTSEVRPAASWGPDAAADLAEETKAGRTAATALFGGAIAYAGEYFLYASVFASFWHAYRTWFDRPVGERGTLVLPRSAVLLQLVSPVFSIALLVVGILFLLWFYKAATLASRAGLAARRSPGWAVGGWFIPIVSLWFPYQSAVDLFPPGHPGRSKVKHWWALWLLTQFAAVFVFAGAIASTAVGLAVAVIASVLAFAAAAAARAVIDEVDRVHAGLVGR